MGAPDKTYVSIYMDPTNEKLYSKQFEDSVLSPKTLNYFFGKQKWVGAPDKTYGSNYMDPTNVKLLATELEFQIQVN